MPAAHTPHSPFAQSPHLDPRTPLYPPPGPLQGLPTPGVPARGQMEPWGPSSPPFSLLGWARRGYPLGSTPSAACRRQREGTGASLLRSSPSVPLAAAPRPAEVTGEVLPASPSTAPRMWARVCVGASQTVDLSEEVHELLDCVRPPTDKDSPGHVQQISILHVPPAPPAAAGPCSLPTLVLGSQMGSRSPDWFAPCAAMGLSPKSGINPLTPM